MISTAIVFDHRGRTKRGAEGPLEVRVTVERKPYYINTGVHVCKSEWKYGAVIDRPDAVELNERLTIVLRKIQKEINDCIENRRQIDVAEVRRKVLAVDDGNSSKNDFLDWLEERIEIVKPTLGEGTVKHYYTMMGRLKEFGEIRRFADVTVDNILKWDSWLHEYKPAMTKNQAMTGAKAKPLGDSTIYGYHKNLKKFLYIAEKVGKINRNPYSLLHGEFKRGDRESVEYLTEAEMDAIRQAPIQKGSHTDMVRDLFIVQMFTGMAYADLMKFDIADYKEVDGVWMATAERVKSGVAFIGHLLPPVVEVLKKYEFNLPRMTNQVYNRALKDVQKKAGIATPLHSHLARHTFATFMLNNGVKVENLQRMMGHTDIKMTQRYAKTLAQSVHSEFDMIAKKLK